MSSSIRCLTTDRLLSRGSSDSDDEELLGGRLFFGVFGSFTGGFGLFTDPLGRPRGRFTGAAGALGVTDSADSVESTTGASGAVSVSTNGSNTTSIFKLIGNYFCNFRNLLNGFRCEQQLKAHV